ncbi:hypothetical protein QBC47DRAFT_408022 [Echria macrotheca]|uniref:Uncharacterized protein n=1 Tax=Echria macrotheca TaxID=438768 RepID=A0AAJ0B0Q2_9PEZI|nr:hypothetical protein QBC47DRAFT_408022 [Echria macrotheca]
MDHDDNTVIISDSDPVTDMMSSRYEGGFIIDNTIFNGVVHFMIFIKAVIFGDNDISGILKNSVGLCSSEYYNMGRTVSRFDRTVWHEKSMTAATITNMCKFTQST